MKLNYKKEILNIVGLILTMGGVVIIFIFGPPQPNFFPFEIPTDSNINQEVLNSKAMYECLSRLGLGLIFIGFLFQLVAASISYWIIKNINKKVE